MHECSLKCRYLGVLLAQFAYAFLKHATDGIRIPVDEDLTVVTLMQEFCSNWQRFPCLIDLKRRM